MPSTSKQQQKYMGLVYALKKGDVKPSDVSKDVRDTAKRMSKSDIKKYASTKHKGLPSKKESLYKQLEELIKKIDETWSDKYKQSKRVFSESTLCRS